jgi:hypothetical protein
LIALEALRSDAAFSDEWSYLSRNFVIQLLWNYKKERQDKICDDNNGGKECQSDRSTIHLFSFCC